MLGTLDERLHEGAKRQQDEEVECLGIGWPPQTQRVEGGSQRERMLLA